MDIVPRNPKIPGNGEPLLGEYGNKFYYKSRTYDVKPLSDDLFSLDEGTYHPKAVNLGLVLSKIKKNKNDLPLGTPVGTLYHRNIPEDFLPYRLAATTDLSAFVDPLEGIKIEIEHLPFLKWFTYIPWRILDLSNMIDFEYLMIEEIQKSNDKTKEQKEQAILFRRKIISGYSDCISYLSALYDTNGVPTKVSKLLKD